MFLSDGTLDATFSRELGALSSLQLRGEEILAAPLQLRVWSETANQNAGAEEVNAWRVAGLDNVKLSRVTARIQGESITLGVRGSCKADDEAFFLGQIWTLQNGILQVNNHFTVSQNLPDLPRLGLTLALLPGFDSLEWPGRGSHENYCDRCAGSYFSRFQSSVAAQDFPYVVPQEHGNSTEVRSAKLENGALGLEVAALDTPFKASASHFTPADLFAARHTFDLQTRPHTQLNLDVKQRGLGTASHGPDASECPRIGAGEYEMNLALRLYKIGE